MLDPGTLRWPPWLNYIFFHNAFPTVCGVLGGPGPEDYLGQQSGRHFEQHGRHATGDQQPSRPCAGVQVKEIIFLFIWTWNILDKKMAAILNSMAAMQQQINSLPDLVQEYR
jgi:hypothetical protein